MPSSPRIASQPGMTVPETLRYSSVMLTAMGLAGLLIVLVLAWMFPMV